jgi:hypothetical protein
MYFYPTSFRIQITDRLNSKRNDAILARQLEGSEKVNTTLRGFLEALSQGHIHMKQLLGKESASIKEVISDEAAQLNEAISTRVVLESGKTRAELSTQLNGMNLHQNAAAECAQLLKSLKYDTLNERRNQIVESHERTCEWIFGDEYVEVSAIACHREHWLVLILLVSGSL